MEVVRTTHVECRPFLGVLGVSPSVVCLTLCGVQGIWICLDALMNLDEFLIALGMCGCFKYADAGMSVPQRVEAWRSAWRRCTLSYTPARRLAGTMPAPSRPPKRRVGCRGRCFG